jgi:hypothetical protein
MAATTSLIVSLIMTGASIAQTLVPAPPDWHNADPGKPQPFPAVFRNVAPVQFDQKDSNGQPAAPKKGRILLPVGYRIKGADEKAEFAVQVIPPGLDRLTRRISEKEFYDLLREESRREPGVARIYFPDEEPVSTEQYTGRVGPYMVRFVEPFYVCHKPLYFEQKNFERYGWDLGVISPGIEAVRYYYDLVMLPYHVGADTCHCFDCSAGKCLPGDPVPLLCYPERFSITGLVFEASSVFGIWFAFQ